MYSRLVPLKNTKKAQNSLVLCARRKHSGPRWVVQSILITPWKAPSLVLSNGRAVRGDVLSESSLEQTNTNSTSKPSYGAAMITFGPKKDDAQIRNRHPWHSQLPQNAESYKLSSFSESTSEPKATLSSDLTWHTCLLIILSHRGCVDQGRHDLILVSVEATNVWIAILGNVL